MAEGREQTNNEEDHVSGSSDEDRPDPTPWWLPPLRVRAAWHEIRCAECRATWGSWAERLVGLRRGYSPQVMR